MSASSTDWLTTAPDGRTLFVNRTVEEGRTPMAADPLSRVFAALADPTRRDMVARLAVADATVGELAEPYDVSVQAVSKHLRVLEDAGLVSRSRDAQRRPVHLEPEVLDLMTTWIERYRQQAEERYRRLDDVLASMPDDVSPADPTQERNPS
jgi:DNA-binding transcriptional ArsR family regulator